MDIGNFFPLNILYTLSPVLSIPFSKIFCRLLTICTKHDIIYMRLLQMFRGKTWHRKEGSRMDLITFVMSVIASVIANYISKLMDKHD